MAKSKMTTCAHCGAEIASSAKVCPNCGGKNKKPIYKRPWFIVVAVLLAIVIISSIGSGSGNKTQKVGNVTDTESNTANDNAENNDTAQSNTADDNSENNTTDTEEPAEEVKEVYRVGDILKDGNVKIVYVSSGEYVEENEFLQPKEGNKYIFVEFAFINEGTSDTSVSWYSFDAYADGYAAEMNYSASTELSATLSAGRSTIGKITFEVPKDAEDIEIEYTPNVFLNDKIKFAYEGEKDSGYELENSTNRVENTVKVGETYETSSLKINYISCEDDVSDNMFSQPKDGFHYVTLKFEFENISKSDKMVSAYSFNCYADGKACEAAYYRDDMLSATISAGRKATGTVSFEIPDDAEVVEVELDDNIWTSSKIVFFVK